MGALTYREARAIEFTAENAGASARVVGERIVFESAHRTPHALTWSLRSGTELLAHWWGYTGRSITTFEHLRSARAA